MKKFVLPSAVVDGLLKSCSKREFLFTELPEIEMNAPVFDDFFKFTEFREGDLRVIRNGKALADTTFLVPKVEGPITMRIASKEKLSQFFNDGYTLVFGKVNNKSAYFYDLSACINEALNVKSWINCYLTPAGSRGFDAHADDHDVLILQASGCKRWIVEDFQSNRHDIVMKENSLMYIPKGMVHQAFTNHGASLHYTIGFNVDTVFSRIMPHLYNTLVQYADNVIYNRELDETEIKAVKTSLLEALDNIGNKPEAVREIAITGLLSTAKSAASISDDTHMQLAKNFQVHIDGDTIRLVADITISLPIAAFPVVQKMKMIKSFTLRQIAADQDIDIIPFIRQMLSYGFVVTD